MNRGLRQRRRVVARIALGLFALPLAACSDAVGPPACTAEFRYGLTIEVRDGATGLGAAVGAEGTITEGDFVEVMEIFGDDTMLGAGERAGTYDIRITKPGFNDWTASPVTVTADECHVNPVALQANLIPVAEGS